MRSLLRLPAMIAFALAISAASACAATINIINLDGPGEGFNDPTPAAPVGGNPGTTIGQQRLNCFTHAAAIWGGILTSSVPINIQAAFNPLTCTATSAVLGSAGPTEVFASDPSFPVSGHWYHPALANKFAGVDLSPTYEINAQFNSNLGQAGCLTGSGWYYGFDHNEGAFIDLIDVLLHEFGHGLGFSTVTSGSSGAYISSTPALWDKFLYDETTALHWDQMTATQRVASAINTNNLTWDGAEVKSAAPGFLSHSPELGVTFGSGTLSGNAAAFGASLTLAGVNGQAIVVNDGVASASTSDGCETPFVNAAQIAGQIAVIDRGTCTFVAKVKNAQLNGAVGVILVNNAAGAFSPGGSDPTITIPVIAISQADGTTLKAAIAGGPTAVSLRLSATSIAGLHPSGRVRMYSPNPYQSGSSVSHYDVSLTPNALMEPAINADLTDSIDLTEALFRDLGWLPGTVILSVPGGNPAGFVALASSPNPARGHANVHFVLTQRERVALSLFDVTGRKVRDLVQGDFAAGGHDVAWDGLDAAGRAAAPGVYLARLKGDHTDAMHRLVLVN